MFHLLHSLTLNLSYPSPLVSFMRPRLTGEINWECNFIFSGGLRETRLNEGKDEFHVRTFWFKFCSSSSVSSPLQKEYVHRAPHPGEERDGGGESESNHLLQQLLWRQKVSASCSVVLWIIQCVSKFMSTFSYLVYFSCLRCERSNHQSHFLQSQMLRRKAEVCIVRRHENKLETLHFASNKPRERVTHRLNTMCNPSRRKEKVKRESVWLQQHKELFQISYFWYLTNQISDDRTWSTAGSLSRMWSVPLPVETWICFSFP